MFDWLFKPAQPVINSYSTDVKVTSSRHGTKIYTVYGDSLVDSIDALRIVADNLPVAEPGESREIKTSFPWCNQLI